jgi:hypothetical protein
LGHPVHFPDDLGDGIAGAHHDPETMLPWLPVRIGLVPAFPFRQRGPHHPDDFRMVKRLGQIIKGPGPHGGDRGGDFGVGGNEDHRQLGLHLLDPLQYFHAVDAGHLDIHQQQVRPGCRDHLQGRLPVRRHQADQPFPLQKRGEHRAELLVIIHYEHPGYIYIHGTSGFSEEGKADRPP